MNITKIKISGMTCSGCEETVTKALENVDEVKSVVVSLQDGSAIINLENEIPIDRIQKSLPEKYQIQIDSSDNFPSNTKQRSYLSDLYPLFLILFYITVGSVIMSWDHSIDNFMMDFMGLFFIVFSFFKFLDYKNFPNSFSMYDPLAKNIPIYGWVYPFIETALGLMFLFKIEIYLAIFLTVLFLSITTVGVVKVLSNKEEVQCACLGTAIKLPMTVATLIENSIMIVMAIATFIKLYG